MKKLPEGELDTIVVVELSKVSTVTIILRENAGRERFERRLRCKEKRKKELRDLRREIECELKERRRIGKKRSERESERDLREKSER